MLYGKYKNIRNAAWQVLIDNGICTLPVQLSLITDNIGVKIIDNKYVNELKYGERGLTINVNNKWYIIVNDLEPIPTQRFTVAHELGHILLGHFIIDKISYRTFGKRTEEEQVADMFAARLLAPACVLHEIRILTPERIKEVCNISITAATIRSERMAELEKRNKFYLNPLELKVRNQFENFINQIIKTQE